MREILFRGKRLDGLGWVKGDYLRYGDYSHGTRHPTPCIITSENEGGYMTFGRFLVYEETIGQYIGMNDENGNPIFEGDILWMDNFTPNVCEVRFIEGAFCLVFPEPGPAWPVDIHYIQHAEKPSATIIGNIHDNPELLEVKTDA